MSGMEQSVLYMKVTEALRSASPSNIAELSKTYNIADFPNLLILAVELSPFETVEWVIKLYEAKNRDFNEADSKTGNTALHIAVVNGRIPIVRELMSIASLDDTIRNKEGLTASELASGSEMESTIAHAENKYAENMSVRLKSAFKDRNLHELEQIYSNPRVSQVLNINGIDPETGRTVLHDAAQANDSNLCKFILAHGGDPMIKDRKTQRLPQAFTSSGDIQMSLNNYAKSRAIMDRTSTDRSSAVEKSPPSMEGYSKKWTNLTSGYKSRYFVLKDGKLSYYKKPEDIKRHRGERGSISLRHATVRLDSSEKNKFEIHDENKSRYFLKATHPADTNKWVWVLKDAIMYTRDREKAKTKHRRHHTASSIASTNAPATGTATAATAIASAGENGATAGGRRSSSSGTHQSVYSTSHPSGAEHVPLPAHTPGSGSAHSVKSGEASPNANQGATGHMRVQSSAGSQNENDLFVNDSAPKADDDDDDDSDEESDEVALQGPQISAESIIARLSALKDLMTMSVSQVQDEFMRDALTTAQGSIDVLSSDIVMLERQAKAHLHKSHQELERSEKNQRMWASNYRDLELQYEKLEGEAHAIRKKLGDSDDDEFFDTFDNAPTATKHNREAQSGAIPANPVPAHDNAANENRTQNPGTDAASAQLNNAAASDAHEPTRCNHADTINSGDAHNGEANAASNSDSHHPSAAVIAGAVGGAGAGTGAGAAAANSDAEAGHAAATASHENDCNTETPNTQHSDEKAELQQHHDDWTPAQEEVEERILKEKSFAGYEKPPRTRLKIDADNRPRLSLWGILKNLIGKDMTKMTLPVTFNECTSLLQRSAEDMEYVDLLDRAAEAADDPGLRMAYVAAFAGSSYSSTINRVAKPFNPLLGETYEYSRPDKGYRSFSEQVSHHPPIGALIAESKNWDFYGESNVESKFYGRSFDINPLGLWYLNLRPNKGAEFEEELYSFRKLTSSVVGIMIGNPVVDNYGDMTITNHTTGVRATISYKARGWRGSSAYKLQGKIIDKNGKELWTIAGQWNDKMWGMKSGSDEKILLWQVHPRHKTPFNLTDFAITLNDSPDESKPWLPPTDTRLRPDQRAMEEGRYDDASDDKARVEEKQRAARREREAKGIDYKPQWFESVKHPVTGLDYYKPVNHYWQQRANKDLSNKGDIF